MTEPQFYRGRERLDRLIAEWWRPISEVVEEVERLVDDEARCSAYYRDNPHLQYEAHPWIRLVRTGELEYLGWWRDMSLPTDEERQRMLRRVAYVPQIDGRTVEVFATDKHRPKPVRRVRVEEKPVRELEDREDPPADRDGGYRGFGGRIEAGSITADRIIATPIVSSDWIRGES